MPSAPAPIHEEGLRHQLSAGQMAMVAVGGSIGTGLLLGSGAAMEVAGPAAILSFIAAAFINWTVAMALGELACAHPAAGSFGVYGDLYLNPFAGYIARAGYWLGLALAIGAEMIAAATYMATWFPGVRPYIWIVVFAALLLAINLRSVGSYGRVEFWLSMIKARHHHHLHRDRRRIAHQRPRHSAIQRARRILSQRPLVPIHRPDLRRLQLRRS